MWSIQHPAVTVGHLVAWSQVVRAAHTAGGVHFEEHWNTSAVCGKKKRHLGINHGWIGESLDEFGIAIIGFIKGK